MTVSHAIKRSNGEAGMRQFRFIDIHLVGPFAIKGGNPNIGTRNGQLGRGIFHEHHVFLLLMANFCPRLYHVGGLVGAITKINEERLHLILRFNRHQFPTLCLLAAHFLHLQIERNLSVGMLNGQCREAIGRAVERAVCHIVERSVCPPHFTPLPLIELCAIIGHTWCLTRLGEQQ